MKRASLIVITAIYLFSCVGIDINRFYCCGKLASVTVGYSIVDKPACKAHNKNNCCKNEKQNFKLKDSHVNAVAFHVKHAVNFIFVSYCHFWTRTDVKPLFTPLAYNGNAPPGTLNVPVYTLNCSYRI